MGGKTPESKEGLGFLDINLSKKKKDRDLKVLWHLESSESISSRHDRVSFFIGIYLGIQESI